MRSPVWSNADIAPSQPYGWTTLDVEPLWNGRHFHCGIDIPMNVGTPLHAARDGSVGSVGPGFLGVCTGSEVDWYIHIDRATVGFGARVTRGQVIAYSGNKSAGGFTTGAHLHFEVQHSVLALTGYGGSSFSNNFGRPGNLNYPATSINPSGVLTGTYGASSGVLREDDMLYISPFTAHPASIRAFAPGSVYSDPSPAAHIVGAVAKDALVSVSGYLYSSASVLSPDTSATTGTQPGQDPLWWKVGTGFVPDAILDTSKLAGAPSITIPANTPFTNYFALAGTVSQVDVAALAQKVAALLPPFATPQQVSDAIKAAFATAKLSLS